MRVAHPYMRGLGERETGKTTERAILEMYARLGMTPGTWSVVDGSSGAVLQYDASDRRNRENFGSDGFLTESTIDAAWRSGRQIELRPGERPYWEQGGLMQRFPFLEIGDSSPTPQPPTPPNDATVLVPKADKPEPSGGSSNRGPVDWTSLERMLMMGLFLVGVAVAYHVVDRTGR